MRILFSGGREPSGDEKSWEPEPFELPRSDGSPPRSPDSSKRSWQQDPEDEAPKSRVIVIDLL
jgi:hypothetical protein